MKCQDNSFINTHSSDHIQQCTQLAGMMRVIVIDISAIKTSLILKSSADAGVTVEPFLNDLWCYSDTQTGGSCGKGIFQIVPAGDLEFDPAYRIPL